MAGLVCWVRCRWSYSKQVMDKAKMIAKLKRMNPAQIYLWGENLYKQGYMDGLRDGESEFDDAVIITEEEAREQMSNDVVDRILNQK